MPARMPKISADATQIPSHYQSLCGAPVRIIPTSGEFGACSIHSIYGETQKEGHSLSKHRPREFLADQYSGSADTFCERVNDAELVQRIEQVLWKDLVKPYAADWPLNPRSDSDSSSEGELVWKAMRRCCKELADECVTKCQSDYVLYVRDLQTKAQRFSKSVCRSLRSAISITFGAADAGFLGYLGRVHARVRRSATKDQV